MNTYFTQDFYCAAYLLASGIPLAGHERHDGKSDFIFPQTAQLKELTNRYYSFSATINPLTYAAACKNLKGTMYNTTTTTTTTNDTVLQQFRKV